MKQVVHTRAGRTGCSSTRCSRRWSYTTGTRPSRSRPATRKARGRWRTRAGRGGQLGRGAEAHDLDDLNGQSKAWRDQKAEREHRTTREQPAARLDEERPKLIALPERRFDVAESKPRQVGDDFCIPWDTNRYSAGPRHTGKQAGRACSRVSSR